MSGKILAVIALVLVLTSILLYGLHYLIFRDAHHIFIYLLGDMAFLPLEVLLVTLIIDRVLSRREMLSRQHKMNMVIGAFFSTMGRSLLKLAGRLLADHNELYSQLVVDPQWTEPRMREASAFVRSAKLRVVVTSKDLEPVRELLAGHREFMLGLLGNPTLLEHEAFTDLLWAISHLEEELSARESLDGLPQSDLDHLKADVVRAYSRLLSQWLDYMIHLSRDYPFLFSFAARTNPFRSGARPEVV